MHQWRFCSCLASLSLFLCSSRGLDTLSKKGKTSMLDLPIESVSLSLQDLIGYFQPPDEHLEHEDKQNRLRALKNRQNLFQEEVCNFVRPYRIPYSGQISPFSFHAFIRVTDVLRLKMNLFYILEVADIFHLLCLCTMHLHNVHSVCLFKI